MRIATSLNVCTGRCCETAIMPRLAAAGYEGLDFNFIDMVDRLDWLDEAKAGRWLDELDNAARAARLVWVQGHGPMFSMFADTPKDGRHRTLCVPAIRACARLKVPWMVLHPDVFAGAFDTAHRKALRDRNAEFFRTLLPECEKRHVGLALENIFDEAGRHDGRNARRYYGSAPDELCELIDALNHPLVGACWDTGHARIMGLDQRAALAALGSRLKVVHIQENDGGNDDHMLPFHNGPGGVDWSAVTDGLRAAGFQGAFTYEVHNAFRALPEALFDHALRYSVEVARYLTARIGGTA